LIKFETTEVKLCKLFLPVPRSVASPKFFGGGEVYDFRRITLLYLEKRLSKHKITIFQKFGGPWPPWLCPCHRPVVNMILFSAHSFAGYIVLGMESWITFWVASHNHLLPRDCLLYGHSWKSNR